MDAGDEMSDVNAGDEMSDANAGDEMSDAGGDRMGALISALKYRLEDPLADLLRGAGWSQDERAERALEKRAPEIMRGIIAGVIEYIEAHASFCFDVIDEGSLPAAGIVLSRHISGWLRSARAERELPGSAWFGCPLTGRMVAAVLGRLSASPHEASKILSVGDGVGLPPDLVRFLWTVSVAMDYLMDRVLATAPGCFTYGLELLAQYYRPGCAEPGCAEPCCACGSPSPATAGYLANGAFGFIRGPATDRPLRQVRVSLCQRCRLVGVGPRIAAGGMLLPVRPGRTIEQAVLAENRAALAEEAAEAAFEAAEAVRAGKNLTQL